MSASRAVRRLPLVLAALVAAPLLLGACGSSSNTASTTDQPLATSAPRGTSGGAAAGTTSTTEPDDEDTTTTTRSTTKRSTTTTEADEDTTTTTKDDGTPPVTAAEFAEYCAVGEKYNKQFKGVDEEDPAYLPQFKAAFQELTAAAPAEIRPDMDTINDFVQQMTNMNDLITAPKAVQDAFERLDTVSEDKCGEAS